MSNHQIIISILAADLGFQRVLIMLYLPKERWVPSRFMRKTVCRLRLNKVSRQ